MPDNTILNPGVGGDVARSIDRSGVKTQVVAIDLGGEAGPEKLLDGAGIPITAEELPLPVGAATQATLATLLAAAQAIQAAAEALNGKATAINTGAVAGTVALDAPATEATLAQVAAAVGAHDAVAADGRSGMVMLAKRRDSDAAAMVADGDFAFLSVDETQRLKVSTQPASYVSGSGNITANAQTVFLNVERASNVTISMVATSLVGHNATFEYSNNSTNGTDGNWYVTQVARSNANTAETATGVLVATPAYGWELSVNAYKWIRVRATAHTSGTAAYLIVPGSYATEPVPIIQVTGTQPVSFTQPALVAGTARVGFIAGAGIWYDDSSAVLASAATFTGTNRDATVTATATAFANAATYAKEVRALAESDQSGTLWLEVSRDNTNWRRVRSVPTAAITGGGQAAELVYLPAWRYWRIGFTNGATLQTRFSIGTVAMAA